MKKFTLPHYAPPLLLIAAFAGLLLLGSLLSDSRQPSQDQVQAKFPQPIPPLAKPLEPTEVPPIASPVDPSTIHYEDYLRASCRLRGGGSGGSGTCFGIDSRYVYVLTCRHVVGNIKKFKVEFWIDGRITGKYDGAVSRVLKVDAAVILIPVGDFKEGELPFAIPISPTPPTMDSKVIVSVGSPALRWQSLFEGQITGLSGLTRYGTESLEFIPAPTGGQSGAGIIQDGRIVGVLWGSSDKSGKSASGRGYAVNSKDLQSLTKAENLYFMATWCGFCDQMKPVLQAVKKNGYSIRTVDYDFNVALAKLYGVTSLPSYVNHSGEVMSGVQTAKKLSEFYDLTEVPPPAPEPEFVPPREVPPPAYRSPPQKPRQRWRLFQ